MRHDDWGEAVEGDLRSWLRSPVSDTEVDGGASSVLRSLPMPLQTGERILHQIVSTVASSVELSEVLRAVVRLMSEASGVHGCFVYLVEDGGAHLVLRAASPPYERHIGDVILERGEGLAWWAAERREPAFIRENALDDPRTKYVAEFEEEKFQSLLAARACHVYLLDPGSEELERRASDPEPGSARRTLALAELGPELVRGGRSRRLAIPLVANGELVGLLVAEGSSRIELARAVASQVAVGIKKVQLIEQLTEKNLIKDFFEELAGGRSRGNLEGRAARLGCDLTEPHVALVAEPADETFDRSLRHIAPGSLFDRREDSLRALVRLRTSDAEAFLERLRQLHAGLATLVSVGVSSVARGEEAFAAAFAEAQQALLGTMVLRGGPAILSYEELGPYKYLLRIALEGGIRDKTVDAVSRVAEYDAQRGSQLVATLEEFLRRHGNISSTSEALFVHPNTLRQRLRRIAELSGLDLRTDDWLTIEIAVKMVKLQQALGSAKPDI